MLAIVMYHKQNDDYIRLAYTDDTETRYNWFIRRQLLDYILMTSRVACNEVQTNQVPKPVEMKYKEYLLLVVASPEDLYCVLVTEEKTQTKKIVGPNVAYECMRDYQRFVPNWSTFETDQHYPLPKDWLLRSNPLDMVQSQVQQIQVIMLDNLQMVIDRAEALDSIDKKATKLHEEAIKFGKLAKKQNKCCKLM